MFGTNYIERIEEALMRSGRIDRRISVVYPDQQSRLAVIGKYTEKLIEKARAQEKKAQSSPAGTQAQGVGSPAPAAPADGRSAALYRAAEMLDQKSGNLALPTKQWSWMSLDAACAELARELEERAGEDEAWMNEKVNDLVSRYDAMVANRITRAVSPVL